MSLTHNHFRPVSCNTRPVGYNISKLDGYKLTNANDTNNMDTNAKTVSLLKQFS